MRLHSITDSIWFKVEKEFWVYLTQRVSLIHVESTLHANTGPSFKLTEYQLSSMTLHYLQAKTNKWDILEISISGGK